MVTMALGFAIYHFFLSPNNRPSHSTGLATQALFTANLPNENGVNQALSKYKGKIIVLNFWATWCAPCREEMPELSQLYEEYKSKNVVVLGVAVDELALVKEFSQATPVSYPLFAAENDGMNLTANLGNDKGVLHHVDHRSRNRQSRYGVCDRPRNEAGGGREDEVIVRRQSRRSCHRQWFGL